MSTEVSFTVQQLAQLTGCKVRTVALWVKRELIPASIAPPRGRRQRVLLSLEDVLEGSALAALRAQGLSMQKCRALLKRLRSRGERLQDFDVLLVVDDQREVIGLRAGRISAEALLKHPGQVILLPARRWRERAERLARKEGEREVEIAGASA